MNIQIFGKNKCFDTKKAERYFKERRIPFQSVNLLQKGMSKRELLSVRNALGGWENMVAETGSEAVLFRYLSSEEAKLEKLLEHPEILRTPIVRNGQKATVGYSPAVWKTWEE